MPKVPCVRWSARGHIDALRRPIESFLVFPLAIVHARGCIAATVHGDEQAAASLRHFTVYEKLKLHFVPTKLDGLRFHLSSSRGAEAAKVIGPEHLPGLVGIGLGERGGREGKLGQVGPLGRRQFQVRGKGIMGGSSN